ncbi:MAG: nuclear transport factor 2 family protein [Acidimicrobiales bacterium]
MSHPRHEVAATLARYVELREKIETGVATWVALTEFFTDDAVYIDPAWGRIEGIGAIREFLVESMTGLEDWRFPIELTAIDGDDVIVKWTQVLPGGQRQSGWTRLVYAGYGRFSYEEDLLNMAHVLEDLKASGWRPGAGFVPPPATPDRDFSVPGR